MSGHGNKASTESPQTVPEVETSGKKRRPPLPREYRQAIVLTAREHRKRYRLLFLSDPTLKDRGARLYRSLLLPRPRKPGRPGLAEVSLALQMREQGKPWSEIYPACIQDYPNLDPSSRRWRQRELRDRVRSRRYQQRKRRELRRSGRRSWGQPLVARRPKRPLGHIGQCFGSRVGGQELQAIGEAFL